MFKSENRSGVVEMLGIVVYFISFMVLMRCCNINVVLVRVVPFERCFFGSVRFSLLGESTTNSYKNFYTNIILMWVEIFNSMYNSLMVVETTYSFKSAGSTDSLAHSWIPRTLFCESPTHYSLSTDYNNILL
jgi:hypothetical protein